MLVNELIKFDNKLNSKKLIMQRIEVLRLRTRALCALTNKGSDKDTLFDLMNQNKIRISNLLNKVVD